MNAHTHRQRLQGPAGALEVALDHPVAAGPAQGLAVICHPHPLHGGTLDNKVVQTLARACLQQGWRTLRVNVRGVGESEGQWDGGAGETDDVDAALQQTRQPDEPLLVAGFSFGGFIAAQLSTRCAARQWPVQHLVLVGPATRNFTLPAVSPDTLVVHGEADDVVPLQATLDWARPQSLPVLVLPGVGHFFHGQLPLLKSVVVRAVSAPVPLEPLMSSAV